MERSEARHGRSRADTHQACTGPRCGACAAACPTGAAAYALPPADAVHGVEVLEAMGRSVVEGRPRRVGWLDGVLQRYAVRINGLTELVITKLDVLDQFSEIKVCTAYDLDGATVQELPSSAKAWERLKPVYKTLPGWSKPTAGITRFEELPAEARSYMDYLEGELGVEISIISTGPERDQTIVLEKAAKR